MLQLTREGDKTGNHATGRKGRADKQRCYTVANGQRAILLAKGAAFMDRITTSILEAFSKENKLETLKEDERFEHLTAYLTIRRHFSRALDRLLLLSAKAAIRALMPLQSS